MTYLIAVRAGLAPEAAVTIAKSAQEVDDNHIPIMVTRDWLHRGQNSKESAFGNNAKSALSAGLRFGCEPLDEVPILDVTFGDAHNIRRATELARLSILPE